MTMGRWIARLIIIGALVAATGVAGQPASGMHRIGYINSGPAGPNAPNVAAFRSGLADLGYVEGRNLIIEFRWGDQRIDQLPMLVNELLSTKPEVILSGGASERKTHRGRLESDATV